MKTRRRRRCPRWRGGPGGYEMRWWAPNGDDLVADVLLFADARPRPALPRRSLPAPTAGARPRAERRRHPPWRRNLSWLNPDGAAQADVYIARGARVYRLADAPAGQHQGTDPPRFALARAFATIDALACRCRRRIARR